jgi:hypothetical protein
MPIFVLEEVHLIGSRDQKGEICQLSNKATSLTLLFAQRSIILKGSKWKRSHSPFETVEQRVYLYVSLTR